MADRGFSLRFGLGVAALLALAAAAVCFVLLVGGARSASGPPGLIAFTRPDGLYVMRADGSAVHRIMSTGPEALYGGGAAWSPDGRSLVFADWEGIWLMDANGQHRVRVATAERPYWIGVKPNRTLFSPRATNFGSPTWSPDGRRIAFTAFQGVENRDIWIMNADGSNPRRLKKTPYFEGEVDWSPAGGWLVFDSGSWVSDIYLIRTDGTRLRNLTLSGGWVGSGQPTWSADGRRIAFGRSAGIWVMDTDGRSLARLPGTQSGELPDWSPDGHRIVFVRKPVSKEVSPTARDRAAEIYVINADGTGLTRLTHNLIGEGSPAWQPAASP